MGHIIAVLGTQGGVGCTTVAVNVAARLARREMRVLLMDMALPYGDISVFLNLRPSSTLLDGLTPDFDAEMLSHILTIHESGLRVLAAPPHIADAQSVYDNLDQLAGLLNMIQQDYDLIVVDVGHHPNPTTLEILNRAVSIVLVMQPTLVSVKNARLILDWFTQLDFQSDKIVPIVNRVSAEREKQKITIPQQRIESHLKCKLEAQLPLEETTAENAVARGIPIVAQKNVSASLSQALDTFSQYIYRMLVYDGDEIPVQPTRVEPPPSPFKRPSSVPSGVPSSKDEMTTPPATSPSSTASSAIPPSKDETTITILVVDQLAETRENIRKLLAFEPDLKVIATASNGREAVDLVKEHKPNIVIMDVDLPEMDGIEATRLITKEVPTSIVILISVESTADTMRRAMSSGARDFLTKPISADNLYNSIYSQYRQPEAQLRPMKDIVASYDFGGRASSVPLRPAPDKSAARGQSPDEPKPAKTGLDNLFERSKAESPFGTKSFPEDSSPPVVGPSTPPAEEPIHLSIPPTLLDMDQIDPWVEALENEKLETTKDSESQPTTETERPDAIPDWLTSQIPEPEVASEWLREGDVEAADIPNWLQQSITSTNDDMIGTPLPAAPQSLTPDPPEKPKPALSQVQFSAYFPRQAVAETQHGLYVYAHLYEVVSNIRRDVEKYRAELGGNIPQPRLAKSSVELAEGTRITIVPESDVLQFEPESLTKRWKPSWTRFEFDFTPSAAHIDETVFVRVSIQIEGIEIAHIKCAVDVEKAAPVMPTLAPNPFAASNPLAAAKLASQRAELYRKIFISYSRQDNEIARAYKMAQTALGNDVFLDVDNLRSGENWQAALARAIDSADIFQLFWSEKYAQSEYCRYEWDYALKFRCPDNLCEGFIRPVYWSQPMPPPPSELSHLNFKFVPFDTQA